MQLAPANYYQNPPQATVRTVTTAPTQQNVQMDVKPNFATFATIPTDFSLITEAMTDIANKLNRLEQSGQQQQPAQRFNNNNSGVNKPRNFESRNKIMNGQIDCNYCTKPVHFARDCRSRPAIQEYYPVVIRQVISTRTSVEIRTTIGIKVTKEFPYRKFNQFS